MSLTIPVKGKNMKVDPNKPTYESEVLAQGYSFLVRFGDEVVLALTPNDGSEASVVVFAMPVEFYALFGIKAEVVELPNGVGPTEPVKLPQPERPTTAEEAEYYVANWKANGWTKPHSDTYKLRKEKKPADNAATRTVAAIQQRTPRSIQGKGPRSSVAARTARAAQ